MKQPTTMLDGHCADADSETHIRFEPNEWLTTREVAAEIRRALGRRIGESAVRRWLSSGTAAGGVLRSRLVLGQRRVHGDVLGDYLARLVGEEGFVK